MGTPLCHTGEGAGRPPPDRSPMREGAAPCPCRACLEFVENGLTVHYYLRDGASHVGRSHQMDCCLGSPYVSRKHAVVSFRGGRFFVQDTDSKCGTYLNGSQVPLERGQEYEIHPMDVIRFADVTTTLLPLSGSGIITNGLE